MAKKNVDIIIIGGGLTGASLLLALKNSGLKCLMIERFPFSQRSQANFDDRSLALAPSSINILSAIGVWPEIKNDATEINKIHVSEQGSFAKTRLNAKANTPLGYIVEMQRLQSTFASLISESEILAPAQCVKFNEESMSVEVEIDKKRMTIQTKMLVAADGRQSSIRKMLNLPCKENDYKHQAIVANVGLAQPHQGCAYERFTKKGPMALLPMSNQRMALVWALPNNLASEFLQLNDQNFLNQLQKHFGYSLGRFQKIGKRVAWPLFNTVMPKQTKGKTVFIGNAAHTLHPIAGQGFNLSLRDVSSIAQHITQYGLNEEMLIKYEQSRRSDQKTIFQFTSGILNLFGIQLPGSQIMRQAGLLAMDNSTALKNLLSTYASGFGGINTNMACGIKLKSEEKI